MLISRRAVAFALPLAAALAAPIHADLRLAQSYSSHMVFQQGAPIVVRGWADPGAEVFAELGSDRASTRADRDGSWTLSLPARPASATPASITVGTGDERREIADVLIGEVWLCSGQSNMVWPMRACDRFDEFRAGADRPTIRVFTAGLVASPEPRDDVPGTWRVCSPQSIGDFSAVAYHFGRRLSDALDTPIGLVNASWGGSRAEAWIGPERLASVAEGRASIEQWDEYNAAFNRDPAEFAGADVDDGDWLEGAVPGRFEPFGVPDSADGIFWQRQRVDIPAQWAGRDLVLSLAMIDDDDITYFNGVEVGRTGGWQTPRRYTVPGRLVRGGTATLAIRITDGAGPGGIHGAEEDLFIHPADAPDDRVSLVGPARLLHASVARGMPPQHRPSQLHHGMLRPLRDHAYAGVIWYQGENNAIGPGSAEGYAALLPLLIEDWRDFLAAPQLPFYIVQLANLAHAENGDWDFPLVREIQRQVCATMPATGLAVTVDIGDARDIHPRNKHDVGDRLARWALHDVYGIDKDVKSGPLPLRAELRGPEVAVTFETFGSKLAVRGDDHAARQVRGFEIADARGQFHAATARITGAMTVAVSMPDGVEAVSAVRYAWRPDPADANLVEAGGLPATPFALDVP